MTAPVLCAYPFPPMTDRPVPGEFGCSASSVDDRWRCTRSPDHKGRHEAGGPNGQIFAYWNQLMPAEETL